MRRQSQRQKVEALLFATGEEGINSFDTQRVYRIGRLASRIHEIKKDMREVGSPYEIKTHRNKNQSVNYYLAKI